MKIRATPPSDLCSKITRLVQARRWNLEEFSRRARLNRFTVRQILFGKQRRLRSSTVNACAAALGLTVMDLFKLPLEQLLKHANNQVEVNSGDSPQSRYETASQPELQSWLDHNPDRARMLDHDELDELLSLQGVGGPLTENGVEHFVSQIERRRELLKKVRTIAGTDLVDVLEKLVDLIYEKVQPYADRK